MAVFIYISTFAIIYICINNKRINFRTFLEVNNISNTYTNFSTNQKLQARATDIADLLRNKGEIIKREGQSYAWMSGREKISIKGNLWYNQYTQEGGDAIDFARRFLSCNSYPEAVEFLIGGNAATVIQKYDDSDKKQKPFSLPEANTDMRRVYAYLMLQREIDREVIYTFVHERLLYEEANHHNCVFVGYDESGTPRHAHKRGTTSNSTFKCNESGSDPLYSFHWKGSSDRLYIFEAPIDMLSYISMHKTGWQTHHYVALCSVAPHAAMKTIELNKNIKKAILCLDNDEAGNAACERICGLLKREHPNIKVYRQTPINKDFNEDLTSNQSDENEVEECQTLAYS